MNAKNTKIAIVGGGHAGGHAAVVLRQQGHEGPIDVFAEESYVPYQRPQLSKQYLQGKLPQERLLLKPEVWWDEQKINVHRGQAVTGIDASAGQLFLQDGSKSAWDKLILATGVEVIRLNLEAAHLPGIHYLRSIEDADKLRASMARGKKLVVVGGGYIGLEVAAVSVDAGLQVEVLELQERILCRVTSPLISDFYTSVHQDKGVGIHTNCAVEGFAGDATVAQVITSKGEIAADIVVIGVGVRPNTQLAETAGIDCDNGILVNEYGQTNHEHIYACGDCSNHPNAILGQRLRLESVHNAMEQSRSVARHILEIAQPYTQIPWFWSDQYDLKLQLAGLPQDYDETAVRGSVQDRQFMHFYLRGGKVIAVEAINMPREFLAMRKIMHQLPTVHMEQLIDTTISLDELFPPRSS